MSKRNEVQEEALTIALTNRKCGLGISMGVGKTLIGLRYIDHLQKNNKNLYPLKVLVVAPKLSIFQSWKDDAEKFNIDISSIEFSTYLSLNKKRQDEYDIVILDECHNLLASHDFFLKVFKGRILGLSGTPPRYSTSEKGRMVSQYCPILYKYITDDAVEDDIINDYRIIVHMMDLSSVNNVVVKTKTATFYTSEVKNYNYWSERVDDAISPKQKQITSIMRMKALMGFMTKEHYAKKLLYSIDEKCLVFCNTQIQADRICNYSIHSSNPDSEENLKKFKAGDIEKASCVLQISEGVNIFELRHGIIMHSYGNERKSAQRINIPVLYKFL